MTKRMLIDAAHPEQTRVAIVDGNRVEEFDFESSNKKQLRGNIYLAKVTRVEASLQAAFVDYGGNRHGFLAFNEIHPDYYQIPVEDRQKLLEAEAEAIEDMEAEIIEVDEDGEPIDQDADSAEEAQITEDASKRREKRLRNNYRRYKIQEVIKHGQIMLVQVVKEERGTKGAALTTYMSLAGRYCVLMPNTAKGGGISRKITNLADRKRLKKITSDLEIAQGMGLIIRTAGAKRNKTEIKRDYDYLSRLWGTIREKTLKSSAPNLVHQEGGLVRRAVRDLYGKDVESVYVEGHEAYKEAKAFMEMLMPSHANRVKEYTEKYPIFLRYKVEDQLETIHSPEVQLKSGGYLVIHQTEALVAIDVNSGRATRERNVEATALKTNLEAAEESCRQMRLRDLAGLIVIDFIDMEENKNNRAVEKRMKDSLKRDRARVQAGRISMFGLFEMSRQRRRASVIEGTSQTCPTCSGLGVVRSIESSALQALQALESEGMRNRANIIKLTAPSTVALYILNEKRTQIAEIEAQAKMRVTIESDPNMVPPQHEIEVVELDKSAKKPTEKTEEPSKSKKRRGRKQKAKETVEQVEAETTTNDKPEKSEQQTTSEKDTSSPKKRRRGRRGGRSRTKEDKSNSEVQAPTPETANDQPAKEQVDNDKPKRTVRRRRKTTKPDVEIVPKPEATNAPVLEVIEEAVKKPSRVKRPRRTKVSKSTDSEANNTAVEKTTAAVKPEIKSEEPAPKKRRVRKRPAKTTQTDKAIAEPAKPVPQTQKKKVVVEDEVANATVSRKVVRKRPSKKEVTAAPETPTAVKTTTTAKKPRKRKAPVTKSDDAKPATQVPETAPAAKTRARRKPSAKKTDDTPKKTAGKSAVIDKVDKVDKVEKPEKPKKSEKPAKKSKRSWRSRIFGDDKANE